MVSFNNTHKFFLFLGLLASILYLPADTNITPTNISQISQASEPQPQETTSNPLVSHCLQLNEQFEFFISMMASVQGSYGQRLVDVVNPLLIACQPVKKLSDSSSLSDVYKSLSCIEQSALYMTRTLEKGLENADEFNPSIAEAHEPTQFQLMEMFNKTSTALGTFGVKIEEIYQDIQGKMLMHLRNQLTQLDTILQTINTNISNNSSLVNKKDIKQDIMDLRTVLRQIQKDLTAVASNPQAIQGISNVIKSIIQYLNEAHEFKFRKWAVLDIAGEFSRALKSKEFNPEAMLMDITYTNFELAKLEKEAEKIDLTIINKTARAVGDYIVDPIFKYNLALYGLTGVASIGLICYAAYFFDTSFSPEPTSGLRKWLGYPDHNSEKLIGAGETKTAIFSGLEHIGITPEILSDRLKAIDVLKVNNREDHLTVAANIKTLESLLALERRKITHPRIPLSKIDSFLFQQKTGSAAVGFSLVGLASYCYYQIYKENHALWSKKLSMWFAKLKGGAIAKTAMKYDFVMPTTSFDDIIGLEFEKSLVYPHLKYIKDPELWDANDRTPQTGILLTGPTRSGKTFFAKAICGELHKQNPDKTIRFINIDVHDIKAEGIASWMGVAKMFAPCILFIDEIDLLGLQRNQDKSLLSDFLQAMSGIAEKDPKKQVIIIGTTNKPENIDHALLQSGRFALEIRFKYPNMQERRQFILKRLDKFAIDPAAFDIDVDKLVRETHERSFEDIKLIMDSAFIHVGIKGGMITQDIFEWALDTQLRKIVDIDSKDVADSEKRVLAAHYAGQVLTQILLGMEEKIAKVTIRQVTVKVKEESVYEQFYTQAAKQTGIDQGGIFTYLNNDTLDIKSQDEMAKKAKTLLGGRIAERIVTNSCSTFFGWKKNSAFNMVKSIVADGIDIKSLSKSGQNAISDETQAKLKIFELEIEQLLLQHKETLLALTQELLKEKILTEHQIMAVIEKVEGKATTPHESTSDNPLEALALTA